MRVFGVAKKTKIVVRRIHRALVVAALEVLRVHVPEDLLERNFDLPLFPRRKRPEDSDWSLPMEAGEGHFHRAGGELFLNELEWKRDGRGARAAHR